MERRVALLNQVIGIALTFWMCWMLVPQHQRKLWLMKAAASAQSRSQKLAQQAGRLAMRRELAGDRETASQGYEAAYRLMQDVHHRAGTWYEKLRGAS